MPKHTKDLREETVNFTLTAYGSISGRKAARAAIRYLLSDLMYWCKKHNVSFEKELAFAHKQQTPAPVKPKA